MPKYVYTMMNGATFMKQVVNFRLSKQAITTLTMLEKKTHASKTTIIEEALRLYAKKILKPEGKIFDYAGILNETEVDALLEAINLSKHNCK